MSNKSEHKKHVKSLVSTDNIFNVPYLNTHNLVTCECGFYGWLEKETFSNVD